MKTIYEITTFNKPRSNSKKWTMGSVDYSENPPSSLINEAKTKQSMYVFENAESVEQVTEFNAKYSMIIMAPLGMAKNTYVFNMPKLLELAQSATLCSVTGKLIFIAN